MNNFDDLLNIVRKLRSKDGCPWDKKQTSRSLIPYMIEEMYECIDTIEENDDAEKKGELGDLLLHLAFQICLAEENNEFNSGQVFKGIIDKMIRRHPHVFDTQSGVTETQAQAAWEDMKKLEGRKRLLDGIPASMPGLHRAFRLQQKAASIGFDWDHKDQVWEKVEEEMGEFRQALDNNDTDNMEEEFGDILFSLVNVSRFYDVHPGEALRRTNDKFIQRFNLMEDLFKEDKLDMKTMSLEELDIGWNRAKEILKK